MLRRSQVRPLSNHGRSVGRDIGPYEISPARCSRRREEGREEGRCAAHARTVLPQVALGPSSSSAVRAIQYRKSQTPTLSGGCRSIIIIVSSGRRRANMAQTDELELALGSERADRR